MENRMREWAWSMEKNRKEIEEEKFTKSQLGNKL